MSDVDWGNAPEDAEFFSAYYFRKYVGDQEYYLMEGNWEQEYPSESLETHKESYHDFELRPVSTLEATLGVTKGAIKSDGGSSSYYDIQIPDWLFDKICERRYVDGCYIKTEELIEVLGSDFDLGNIIKCAVRINSLKNGVGKEGNDVSYDSNKIIYSANRLKERDKR